MKDKRKTLITLILSLMAITLLTVIIYYWINTTYYVSTEDAKINGDLVKICPLGSGKISELFLKEGYFVKKNEIVGRIEIINLADSNIELSLVRSPINGVILKKQGTVGEIVTAGQILAYVIDPKALYITANIEENLIKKIKIGQKVDVKLDEYKNKKFTGTIDSIGEAANSMFSLLPTTSGSTFTKVVQKVPVKILIDYSEYKLIAGTNAFIKIHIK